MDSNVHSILYMQEEYVKTTNPDAAPLSFSDEQKKEVHF